ERGNEGTEVESEVIGDLPAARKAFGEVAPGLLGRGPGIPADADAEPRTPGARAGIHPSVVLQAAQQHADAAVVLRLRQRRDGAGFDEADADAVREMGHAAV